MTDRRETDALLAEWDSLLGTAPRPTVPTDLRKLGQDAMSSFIMRNSCYPQEFAEVARVCRRMAEIADILAAS